MMEMNNDKRLFEFRDHAPSDMEESVSASKRKRRAWGELLKNRAAAVSVGIITAIVLFALLTPLFITNKSPVSRYMKLGPRSVTLSKIGIATGRKRERCAELSFINIAAIGAEGMGTSSVGDALKRGGEVQPIYKIVSSERTDKGQNTATAYTASIDSYLKIGCVYMYFDEDELSRLQKLEETYDLKIFYPLIAENEYNYATSAGLFENASFWYKTDARGYPLDKEGKRQELSDLDEVYLLENYMRDETGELVYSMPSGERMYKVRVMFYNYYRATHDGAHPEFIFGTDSGGYDLAYRVAVGTRLSLALALSVFIINFIIGAVWGAVSGYFGGRCDLIMQFITYVLSGVPFMVVATLFSIYLAARVGAVISLLFAFVLTGWISTASRVRAGFYRFKGREYVMASRTLGASDGRIILTHIFPNALGTVITASVLTIPGVIFSESMLSYLGIINLGTERVTSLGTLLADAGSAWMPSPHLVIFPGIIISLLMICFNLFGNGLRDALDPMQSGAGE